MHDRLGAYFDWEGGRGEGGVLEGLPSVMFARDGNGNTLNGRLSGIRDGGLTVEDGDKGEVLCAKGVWVV